MSILNLPSLSVIAEPQPHGEDYLITAEAAQPPKACPNCAGRGVLGDYVRFGVRIQMFRDTPTRGKRVGIKVLRRRYRCNKCQRVFMDALPADMDKRHKCTLRLLAYIREEAQSKPFVVIANETGLHPETVSEMVGGREGRKNQRKRQKI